MNKIQYYSNPDVSYFGFPTGSAATANNARCIREYAPPKAMERISDCNLNGICDAHDIAVGTSQDCEHNGIPDECSDQGACCLEGTCTYKTQLCCLYQGGKFKALDYLSGYSLCGDDCNVNGVDDACESPGVCCTVNNCSGMPQDCCIALGGTYQAATTQCGGDTNQNDTPDGCESETLGACCVSGMLCAVWPESTCAAVGGTFGGVGTYCEDCNGNGWPAPCEAFSTREYGACCTPEGGCISATECSCQGSFLGAGTTCTDLDCNNNGVPDKCESGAACCLPDGSCVVGPESCCAQAGGAFLSEDTFCKRTLRACCRPPPYEDCIVTTEPCCDAFEGTFKNLVLTCLAANCPSYNGPSLEP